MEIPKTCYSCKRMIENDNCKLQNECFETKPILFSINLSHSEFDLLTDTVKNRFIRMFGNKYKNKLYFTDIGLKRFLENYYNKSSDK